MIETTKTSVKISVDKTKGIAGQMAEVTLDLIMIYLSLANIFGLNETLKMLEISSKEFVDELIGDNTHDK